MTPLIISVLWLLSLQWPRWLPPYYGYYRYSDPADYLRTLAIIVTVTPLIISVLWLLSLQWPPDYLRTLAIIVKVTPRWLSPYSGYYCYSDPRWLSPYFGYYCYSDPPVTVTPPGHLRTLAIIVTVAPLIISVLWLLLLQWPPCYSDPLIISVLWLLLLQWPPWLSPYFGCYCYSDRCDYLRTLAIIVTTSFQTYTLPSELQALVYPILPPSSDILNYAIGLEKLADNESRTVFRWCSSGSKFGTDNSNYMRRFLL